MATKKTKHPRKILTEKKESFLRKLGLRQSGYRLLNRLGRDVGHVLDESFYVGPNGLEMKFEIVMEDRPQSIVTLEVQA